jgi:ribosome maturation factor RimP
MRNKMIDLENDDTIQIVDYVKVDVLTSGQLEIDDCILIGNEVVSIVDIVSLPDGYTLEVVNDFGERDIIEVGEYEQFDLMILQ